MTPNDFLTFISSEKHGRVRRSATETNTNNTINIVCDDKDLPQPTIDYPLVLFEKLNYNNCSTSGNYIRVKANEYVKWARNKPAPDRGKIMMWNSIITFPGVNITFRGCCPSGNNFVSITSTWSRKTGDMNASIYLDTHLSGADGIWYKDWLYWQISFYLMISEPQDTSAVQPCGTCKFNQCGVTGKCECLPGYTGTTCETVQTNATVPTEQYPLVLYEKAFYTGNTKYLKAGESFKFASNEQGAFGGRKLFYNSMRVYHNRSVVFQRHGSNGQSVWSPGNDVHDIGEFLESNVHFANPIWYNYDLHILLQFTVKVL